MTETRPTAARIAKQPKWVRDLINSYRQEIRILESRLDATHSPVDQDTRVYVTDYLSKDIALKDNDKVRFLLDTESGRRCFIEVGFEYRRNGKDLSAVVVRSEDMPLTLMPSASNTIYVGAKRR